jgi:hypothetical protein
MLRVLLLSLICSGCSSIPSPSDCRWSGVDVRDDDPITGKIVSEHYADAATVAAKCKGMNGCARAPGFQNYVFITPKGEYEIWYSDRSLRTHEWCHALYEEPKHV